MASVAAERLELTAGRFRDRAEAGRHLARRLSDLAGRADPLVLGIPRGGVPVAYEVAKALHAPLDVIVVRKLGFPGAEAGRVKNSAPALLAPCANPGDQGP